MDSSESESMQSSNGGHEMDYHFSTLPPSTYPINLHHVETLLSKTRLPDQTPAPEFTHLVPSGQPPTGNLPGTKTGKKRTRASRRAPTTVLTTDTSNFRAMVQEFTGIPQFSKAAKVEIFGGRSPMDGSPIIKPSPVSSYLLQPFNAPLISSQAQAPFFAPFASTTMAGKLGTNALHANHHKNDPRHLLHFGGYAGASMATNNCGDLSSLPLSATHRRTILSGNDGDGGYESPYGSYNGEGVNNAKMNLNGDSAAFLFHGEKGSKSGVDDLMETWICSSDS